VRRTNLKKNILDRKKKGYRKKGGVKETCFRGAFPPVDFLAVCFVRAMLQGVGGETAYQRGVTSKYRKRKVKGGGVGSAWEVCTTRSVTFFLAASVKKNKFNFLYF